MTDRRPGRLRLALPWLRTGTPLVAPGGGVGVHAPAAEWLVSRGDVETCRADSWRAWLLEELGLDAGLLRQLPAGPCVAALQSPGRPVGTWACARPVHLLTALDHLRLAPDMPEVDAFESDVLCADINRHLEGRGWRLHATRHGPDWLLECAALVDCTGLEPEEAAGENLRDLMPRGRDAALAVSLVNELQMLLHEHPVNEARAARGLAAVNSLWLWGFGCVEPVRPVALPVLYADDAWLRGLWQLLGAMQRPLADFATAFDDGTTQAAVVETRGRELSFPEALQLAERACLAPARRLLEQGAVEEIAMCLGRRVVRVDHRAKWRFWRRSRPLAALLS